MKGFRVGRWDVNKENTDTEWKKMQEKKGK